MTIKSLSFILVVVAACTMTASGKHQAAVTTSIGYPLNDTIPGDSMLSTFVFTRVEEEATFKGGAKAWNRFLENTLKPNNVDAPPGAYTVSVQCIVEKDGSLTELKPVSKHGYGLEEEALRVMRACPNLVPARQNGRIVRAYKLIKINMIIN